MERARRVPLTRGSALGMPDELMNTPDGELKS
jgi:hypothetical protein